MRSKLFVLFVACFVVFSAYSTTTTRMFNATMCVKMPDGHYVYMPPGVEVYTFTANAQGKLTYYGSIAPFTIGDVPVNAPDSSKILSYIPSTRIYPGEVTQYIGSGTVIVRDYSIVYNSLPMFLVVHVGDVPSSCVRKVANR